MQGAASTYGLFAEFGPLILSDQSTQTAEYNQTGVPSLFYNPHAWTKAANILILNCGGPVGYTYCDCSGARTDCGPAGNGTRCGNWDDYRTQARNTEFVLSWLQAYPEYAQLPMFLVGESYAGVYMPMLFEGLMSAASPPNLVGLGLGDACMGTQVVCGDGGPRGPWFSLMFLGGHGCISMPTWSSILEQCPIARLKDGNLQNVSQACTDALALSNVECNWDQFYAYNIYDKCPGVGIHAAAAAAAISYTRVAFADAPVPTLPQTQPNGCAIFTERRIVILYAISTLLFVVSTAVRVAAFSIILISFSLSPSNLSLAQQVPVRRRRGNLALDTNRRCEKGVSRRAQLGVL